MSRIKGRDTAPEKRVRSLLHRLGFRFSLHKKDLPGRPDIFLRRYGTAIFVHGCFWHRHANCKNSVFPKTRADFWRAKLKGNVERDRRNQVALKTQGLKTLVVWECEVEDETKLSRRLIAELAKARHD